MLHLCSPVSVELEQKYGRFSVPFSLPEFVTLEEKLWKINCFSSLVRKCKHPTTLPRKKKRKEKSVWKRRFPLLWHYTNFSWELMRGKDLRKSPFVFFTRWLQGGSKCGPHSQSYLKMLENDCKHGQFHQMRDVLKMKNNTSKFRNMKKFMLW